MHTIQYPLCISKCWSLLQQVGNKNASLTNPVSEVPQNHSNFVHDLTRLHFKVRHTHIPNFYGKATPDFFSANIFGIRQLLSSPRNFTSRCAYTKTEELYLVHLDTNLLEREEGQGTRERNKLLFPMLTLE